MPHIIGSGEIPGCITELFDTDEAMHDKMPTFTGDKLHKAEAFEKKLQAWTTETLKAVERMQAEVDALNA